MPAAAMVKVLVVDDQKSIRALIRSALEGIGFRDIDECGDGAEALRVLATKQFHLIISDYNMPGLDGLGLLRAVRQDARTNKTAFIMLTGRGDRELVQRAVQFGVNNYVVKPFTAAGLKGKIEEVFGALT